MLYLIAGNGAPNFGDELIVAHWLRRYRESGYDGPITVDGKGAEASQRLLRGFGDVTFTSHIPRHSDGLEGTYEDFATLGRDWARANSDAFADVAMIHFCGGGYVSGNWRHATRLLATAAELKRLRGLALVATGLGVGPLRRTSAGDASAWRRVVDAFDLFECRDKVGYLELVDLIGARPALTWGLDDAFLEATPMEDRDARYLHLSGFNRSALFGGADNARIRRFLKDFDKVIFWTCSKADAEVRADLAADFPGIDRNSNERLLNRGIPLAPQDFMLTCRFHPHLLAARTGMSGYYAAHSAFYRAKHAMVTDLGSPFEPVVQGLPEAFEGDPTRMIMTEAGRVEEKRRVADRVLTLFEQSPRAVPAARRVPVNGDGARGQHALLQATA